MAGRKVSGKDLEELVDGDETDLHSHSHQAIGDTNFTGTVSVSGEAGANTPGEGIVEIKNLKITNGLIVDFEVD